MHIPVSYHIISFCSGTSYFNLYSQYGKLRREILVPILIHSTNDLKQDAPKHESLNFSEVPQQISNLSDGPTTTH